VAMALSRLRARHRRVLVLREVEGLSYADIAAELEVSESAVETLLFRARRRLREEFSKREKPMAVGTALGSLRAILPRLVAPLTSNAPLTAKLVFTAAVVAGTAAVSPTGLPHALLSAPNRAGSSLRTTAMLHRPIGPASVGGAPAQLAVGLGIHGSSALDSRFSTAPQHRTEAKAEVRSMPDLIAGVISKRSGAAVTRGREEVSAVHRRHQASAVPLIATPAASPASSVSAIRLEHTGSHLEASRQQRGGDPRSAHENAVRNSAASPVARYRQVTHASGSALHHPGARVRSGQDVVKHAILPQHRGPQRSAVLKTTPTFRPAVFVGPTATKRPNNSNRHILIGGPPRKSGVVVLDPTEMSARRRAKPATPVQMPTPASTMTTTGGQQQPTHGSPSSGTSSNGNGDEGRRTVTPSPMPTPEAPVGTVITAAVPAVPAATAGGNPHGKPRP
jgi:hypothetical protein